MAPGRQDIPDVIRILNEMDERHRDRNDRCCKQILQAIKDSTQTVVDAIQVESTAIQAAISTSEANITAAIEALNPGEEATVLSLNYSLAPAQKRFR